MKLDVCISSNRDGSISGFYCWAIINNGKIISLSQEKGREGGEIWHSSSRLDSKSRLQECLSSLANNFGMNFYKDVYMAAYNEVIDSPDVVLNKNKKSKITYMQNNVNNLYKKYTEARKELDNFKKREIK